jgi:hypothetical protein
MKRQFDTNPILSNHAIVKLAFKFLKAYFHYRVVDRKYYEIEYSSTFKVSTALRGIRN